MKERGFDPTRLDVAAFATQGAQLEGRWRVAELERVAQSVVAETSPADVSDVGWQLRGERRTLRGGAVQFWLHLRATTSLALECQRCLRPVTVPIEVERSFLFVAGDAEAAQADAELDDDVLALSRAFDVRQLVEDELLLALPLVPRHDLCPVPLVHTDADQGTVSDDARPNPFAVLRGLKGSGLQ